MSYSRFETLVLGVGGIAVFGTIVATFAAAGGVPIPIEIAAQVLLFGVLVGAAHWGRKGGFVAAALATVVYVLLRVPLVAEHGFTSTIASMIVTRAATYAIIGVLGGELCSRIRYIFASLEGNGSLDEWTQVYNQRFITRTLTSVIGQHTRYGTPVSIVLVTLAPSLTAELRPVRERKILRGVASLLRNDVRLVDEVGRLDDGRFLVVLPHTPRAGASIAGDRLRAGVQDLLGAKAESITAVVLAAPEDLEALQSLRLELEAPYRPDPEETQGQTVGSAQTEASAS